MSRAQAVFITLVSYKLALVAIGIWASRRTRDSDDFFLGGRQLGGWIAALSASASSSSAWTLLGVSGAAYAWGLSALWLFPATLSGFLINWLWVAPRLMKQSRETAALTLSEFIAGDERDPMFTSIMRLASAVIVFSFLVYVASQFQAAGSAFSSAFGTSTTASIVIGAAIIVLYTLLGGFWAVSVTDFLQGMMMAAAAIFVPVVALIAVGGFGSLARELSSLSTGPQLSLTGEYSGVFALAFVLGTLGIGIGYPGQPHVVNRFMALRDDRALRSGRTIALIWAVIIYSGMLLVGFCARVLFPLVSNREQVLFETANALLPPVAAGIVIAAVLSAIMSTADSQLLVATSSLSYDLRQRGAAAEADVPASLWRSRSAVVIISISAALLAIFAPAAIFSRVLFAWSALGSAFGPLLLLRLSGRRIRGVFAFASIATGFALTVLAHWLFPDAPGDWVERLVPFIAALLVGFAGRRA